MKSIQKGNDKEASVWELKLRLQWNCHEQAKIFTKPRKKFSPEELSRLIFLGVEAMQLNDALYAKKRRHNYAKYTTTKHPRN